MKFPVRYCVSDRSKGTCDSTVIYLRRKQSNVLKYFKNSKRYELNVINYMC